MTANAFANAVPAITDPARYAAAVVPSDTTPLASVARAIWVGTAGNLQITTVGGSTVNIPSASGLLPISATQIFATGTTASGIVILY